LELHQTAPRWADRLIILGLMWLITCLVGFFFVFIFLAPDPPNPTWFLLFAPGVLALVAGMFIEMGRELW
jgi:hypothetical protein